MTTSQEFQKINLSHICCDVGGRYPCHPCILSLPVVDDFTKSKNNLPPPPKNPLPRPTTSSSSSLSQFSRKISRGSRQAFPNLTLIIVGLVDVHQFAAYLRGDQYVLLRISAPPERTITSIHHHPHIQHHRKSRNSTSNGQGSDQHDGISV